MPNWQEVFEFQEVRSIISMVQINSDELNLKTFFVELFNKRSGTSAYTLSVFDSEATSLLIKVILNYSKDLNVVYYALKMYAYHTYMVVFYDLNKERELRLLRYKINKILDPTAVYSP